MNQSILFPDLQNWDESLQAVVFSAQQAGALIECVISKAELEKLSGQLINDGQQALAVFTDYRFDAEELAEELIENEDFTRDGKINITG